MKNEDALIEPIETEAEAVPDCGIEYNAEILIRNQITVRDGTTTALYDEFYRSKEEELDPPDPRYVPIYTREDIDKIVMMLTLWIPEVDIRNKLEEIYQCWKDTQKP